MAAAAMFNLSDKGEMKCCNELSERGKFNSRIEEAGDNGYWNEQEQTDRAKNGSDNDNLVLNIFNRRSSGRLSSCFCWRTGGSGSTNCGRGRLQRRRSG